MLTFASHPLVLLLLFAFNENIFTANSTDFVPAKSLKPVLQIQRKQREVQLNTDFDREHTSLTFATTEEIILYISLALGILLIATCCCVCWKYCYCDVRQSSTIIYQQMPASQMPTVIHEEVRLTSFPMATSEDSSRISIKTLIPMTSFSTVNRGDNVENDDSHIPAYSAL